ncbi:putative Ubiquitin-conjugating enzyme [Blattamonas nauphoetae]|uniref:Ubiquitin-conjugating enzyme n=1 Tax=Blattamonas nauphoetae TaxID=2049346 RepID=A0ABQ9XDN5_9EUKA|nr:putative Ubiquitin-conjugating enzyme [Blattamonas nauphoetae]
MPGFEVKHERDIKKTLKDQVTFVSRTPSELTVKVKTTEQSPYKGREFTVKIKGDSFPLTAPTVRIASTIFHPAIEPETGKTCLIITTNWNAKNTIIDVLREVYQVLSNPDPAMSNNTEAQTLISTDREAFNKRAFETTD